MKVLFWIINFPGSVGETTNAALFANDLVKNGVDCYFYEPEGFIKSYLMSYQFKFITKNDLETIDFDLLILSEYYSLLHISCPDEEKKKIEFIQNFSLKKNIPVATIDILGLGSSKEEIYKHLNSNPKLKSNYSEIIIPNEKIFFSIKPCPINTPSNLNFKNNNFYWMFPKLDSNLENQNKVRKMFDIPENAKIIFLPISKWNNIKLEFRYKSNFIFILGQYILNLLSKMNLDINIYLFLGVPNYQVQKFQNKNLTLCYFNPDSKNFIKPEIYENFLSMCDVILTIHLIQNSFIRALASGMNGINLTNGLYFDEKMLPLYFKDIKINNFYTVEMLPFEKINNYPNLFETFEIFDENFIRHLEKLLLDNDFNKSKFDNYTKILENNSNTPKEICNKILERIN